MPAWMSQLLLCFFNCFLIVFVVLFHPFNFVALFFVVFVVLFTQMKSALVNKIYYYYYYYYYMISVSPQWRRAKWSLNRTSLDLISLSFQIFPAEKKSNIHTALHAFTLCGKTSYLLLDLELIKSWNSQHSSYWSVPTRDSFVRIRHSTLCV